MNKQIQNLVDKLNAETDSAFFSRIDEAISLLYVYEFIPSSQMIKARNKLVKDVTNLIEIEKHESCELELK